MRKKNQILILMSLLILSSSSFAEDCPKTEGEFVQWYKNQISTMDTPRDDANDNLVQRDLLQTYRNAEKCAEKMTGGATPLMKACMAPAKTLLPAMQSFEVGIRRKDGKRDSAAALVLPRAFSDEGLRYALKTASATQADVDQKLKQLAEQLPKNAKIMQYQSNTVFERSFVVVLPSEKEDIYVHTHAGHPNYLTIRVNKKDAKGKPLDPPKVDFFAVDGATLNADHSQQARCMSCHRSGSIAVLPKDGKFISHTNGFSGPEIETWWNEMRAKNMQKSEYSYDHLGPAIGPSMEATRTTEFVKQCASKEVPGITPERIEVIKNNMDCTSCHETTRGEVLMFPTHTWDFKSIVLDNVILKGHMPMDSKDKNSSSYMTDPERKALLTCLKAEFFGGFTDTTFSQGNTKPGVLLKSLIPDQCAKPALQQKASPVKSVQ